MKKQLLLLAAILLTGLTGSIAQSLTLNNVTSTVTGPNNALLTSTVSVVNTTNAVFPLLVERTIISQVPGHWEYFCTPGYNGNPGTCYPPGTNVSSNVETIPAGATGIFYADVIPNNISGTTSLYYRFYSSDDFSDSVSVQLNFDFTTVGVNEVKNTQILSQPSPNPADQFTVFTYKVLENASNDNLVIYNMLGSKLKTIEIPGTNGVVVVNTSDLRAGVYFVSYQQGNGKLVNTCKLVVSHR